MNLLKKLWYAWHPHYRRVRAKRRLEGLIREYGINRNTAKQITNHYFRKDQS